MSRSGTAAPGQLEEAGPSRFQAPHPRRFDLGSLDFIPAAEAWDGPMQMSLDEALLNACRRPVLRFYRWPRPQVTFGYFGSLAEVRHKFPELPATRRWTGGGIVVHGEDLTFSVVLPATHPNCRLRGQDLYCCFHGAIAAALARGGLDATLAVAASQLPGGECFRTPVAGDVLHGRQKLAGGAMRRTRHGVLYQGSIQGPAALLLQVPELLPCRFASDVRPRSLKSGEVEAAREICAGRYSRRDWLELR